MYTETQLPRLSVSALKVPVWGGGVGSYPLLSQAPTPVEVELGCDNIVIKVNNVLVEYESKMSIPCKLQTVEQYMI